MNTKTLTLRSARTLGFAFLGTLAILACGSESSPDPAPVQVPSEKSVTAEDARAVLVGEGFVVARRIGERAGPGTFAVDILENKRTGQTAYLPVGADMDAPILVMKAGKVDRQLGLKVPSYVGMTEAEVSAAVEKQQQESTGTNLRAKQGATAKAPVLPSEDGWKPEYGSTNYFCCVQTCVNNNLSRVGCTGVGNLLPYCTQVAAIASATCGFSCINQQVACSLAPNCGCGPVCGDGICDSANGENCNNCGQDCGFSCGGGGGSSNGGPGGGGGSTGSPCNTGFDCASHNCEFGICS